MNTNTLNGNKNKVNVEMKNYSLRIVCFNYNELVAYCMLNMGNILEMNVIHSQIKTNPLLIFYISTVIFHVDMTPRIKTCILMINQSISHKQIISWNVIR